jgi:KDO II ethanolaminephosphotransferase
MNMGVNNSLSQIFIALIPSMLLLLVFLVIGFTHHIIYKTFIALQIFLASIAIFFKWQDHVTITSDILLSGMINDAALSVEMISLPLVLWVIVTALLPILWIYRLELEKISFKAYSLKVGKLSSLLLVSLVALLFLNGFEYRKKGNLRDPKFSIMLDSFSPLDVDYSLNRAYISYKRLKKNYRDVKKMSGLHEYTNAEDELTVVFILGETTRGDHFSINGYERETTPKLSRIENLYSFKNVTSCDTLTLRSVPCILSPMNAEQEDRIPKYSAFTDVFKSLGFEVEIYSLQGLSAFYRYLGYDKLVAKREILKNSQEKAQDIALLPFIKDSLSNFQMKKKLLVIHTLGSHQLYIDRVPQEQIAYTPNCQSQSSVACSQESLVNAFDNTVLSVDSFLSSVIEELEDKKAIVVYTSDHGESLGESGIFGHGKPIDIAPKEQFSVPLVFWFSQPYLQTETGKKVYTNIGKHTADTPLSHDNVYHSILGCSGIASSDGGITKELNICSQ